MFATLLLPNFYLQAVTRHQPVLREQPLAVLDNQANKAILLQVNDLAKREGVCAGMAPSQALARCLQLVIKARAHENERQVKDILLHHAFILSPFVEATADGVCTVQFTDYSRLEEKAYRVVNLLAACDLLARAGISDNADTSFLAAHIAQPVLRIDHVTDFLNPLPVETLAFEAT